MFDPAQIAAAVQQALATKDAVPDGHRGAVVAVVDERGARAVVVHKVNDTWVIAGTVEHPWTGGLSYGASVQATW